MKEKVMREIYFAKRQAHSAEWAMPLSFHERFQATTVEPLRKYSNSNCASRRRMKESLEMSFDYQAYLDTIIAAQQIDQTRPH